MQNAMGEQYFLQRKSIKNYFIRIHCDAKERKIKSTRES